MSFVYTNAKVLAFGSRLMMAITVKGGGEYLLLVF